MITVTGKNGFQNGFTVTGHANYGERGADIVCSAVSAVTQTTLLGLLKYSDVNYKMNAGFLDVDVLSSSDIAKALLETLKIGVQAMIKEHPKFIQMEEPK